MLSPPKVDLESTEKGALSSDENAMMCKVAFRAPVFWEADPLLWFHQVESQFVVSGITTDSTKFHSVVAALDARVLRCVREIVTKPPKVNAYGTLKSKILDYYEESDGSRLKKLFSGLSLGDQKPSQFLCELENLNGGKLDDATLRELWLQRLPLNIQQILGVCADEMQDNSKLARLADKVYETSGKVLAPVDSQSPPPEVQGLVARIAELEAQLKSTQRSGRSQSNKRRYRSSSRNRFKPPQPSTSSEECWYHRKFGKLAHKCVSPCSYSENE